MSGFTYSTAARALLVADEFVYRFALSTTANISGERAMIGYVTLGTNDLARGARFYDAIAKELGAGRMMENEHFIAWGKPGGGAGVGLTLPFDGKPATIGNGVMVALEAKDRAQVDRLHQLALSLGGRDEGAPGSRGEGFYAAYFRDLDGNKLNAFVMG